MRGERDDVRGGFRGAWQHRRWRWLLTSTAMSYTADFMYAVAVVVYLLQRTDSPTWIAAAALVRVAAPALFGSLGGALADRVDRRTLMASADLVRAASVLVLAGAVWAEAAPAMVLALSAVAALASVPHRPAALAAVSTVVSEDDLAAANAAGGIVGETACFVGPALVALVIAASDPGWALVVTATVFVMSALLLSGAGPLPVPPPPPMWDDEPSPAASDAAPQARADHHGLVGDVAGGLRVVQHTPMIAAITVITAVVVFQTGVEQVVMVLVAQDRLGMGANGVGVLAAAVGIGGLAVAPFTARLGDSRLSGLALAVSGVAIGVPLALLAAFTASAPALLVLAVAGAGGIVFEVLYVTLLQRGCPEEALARVYGLQESITSVAQFAGAAMAPVLIGVLDLEATLVIAGLLTVVAALALAPRLHRTATAADAERRRLAPFTSRLRRLGIFGTASQATLERLARAGSMVTVSAGAEVFHEGDVPQHLYVVLRGDLTVHAEGQGQINRMGENDWFGEIGLMRGIPRTATVVAATDADLLVIPGRVFLAAVTGSGLLGDPLRRTARSRLARTHPHLLTGDDEAD